MDNEALGRRLQREYFKVLKHDPKKAHAALDSMRQDVLMAILNNRHVPSELRENARLMLSAWGHEWSEHMRQGEGDEGVYDRYGNPI